MPRPACSVEECENPALARGWCSAHYQRWRHTGSPLPPPPVDPIARFWKKIDVRGPEECWPWQGIINPSGYGLTAPPGLPKEVHRAVYQLEVGDLHNDEQGRPLVIDHMCHDPKICHLSNECPHRRCCNPAHMRLTTRAENVTKDRAASGQGRKTHCPRGHGYTQGNTYVYYRKNGGPARFCRTCLRESNKKSRAKRRARERAEKNGMLF